MHQCEGISILNASARRGVNAKIVQDVRDGRSCDADDHGAHFRDLCYHGLFKARIDGRL